MPYPWGTIADCSVALGFSAYCGAIGLGANIASGGNTTMIRKTKEGYRVLSENGKKNLGGPYKSKVEAEKRLRQVEYFKHRRG